MHSRIHAHSLNTVKQQYWTISLTRHFEEQVNNYSRGNYDNAENTNGYKNSWVQQAVR